VVVAIEHRDPCWLTVNASLIASGPPARVSGQIFAPLGGSGVEEADDLFIYRPAHRGRKPGGDLLGGVSALQETDLTGPTSIYKVLPKVHLNRATHHTS
jgi:hypothetical protein